MIRFYIFYVALSDIYRLAFPASIIRNIYLYFLTLNLWTCIFLFYRIVFPDIYSLLISDLYCHDFFPTFINLYFPLLHYLQEQTRIFLFYSLVCSDIYRQNLSDIFRLLLVNTLGWKVCYYLNVKHLYRTRDVNYTNTHVPCNRTPSSFVRGELIEEG